MKIQPISLEHILYKCIYDYKLYNKNCITIKMLMSTYAEMVKNANSANQCCGITKVFFSINNHITVKDFRIFLHTKLPWIKYANKKYYIDYGYTNKQHNEFPMVAPTCATDMKNFYRKINPVLHSFLFGTKGNEYEK